MQPFRYWLLIMSVVVVLHPGCTSIEPITRRSQLADPQRTGPLTVLTKAGTLYQLTTYQLRDSLLLGQGTVRTDQRTQPFRGALNLFEIEYIEARKPTVEGRIAATGAVVAFSAVALAYLLMGETTFSVEEEPYSCPFLYTDDGRQYYFATEIFPGAVCRGVERTSYDPLAHLRPVEGHYRLKVTNERLETDYVNAIHLLVVDAPPGVTVLPDRKGKLHTLVHPVFPSRCVDLQGQDALPAVLRHDGVVWESDLAARDLTQAETLQDGLVLEFRRPPEGDHAKLVVIGGNTALGEFAFEHMFKLRGDNKLRWLQRLEHVPEERRKLVEFLQREGMVHVAIWHAERWVEAAALPAVGPATMKAQVAVLDVSGVAGRMIRIKLEVAPGLWRIDQVSLDCSPDVAVTLTELPPATAVDAAGTSVLPLIRDEDDRYYTILPGHGALLTFPDVPRPPWRQRSSIVKATGYYHQWIEASGEDQADVLDRVLTEPLFARRLLLPLWQGVKARGTPTPPGS